MALQFSQEEQCNARCTSKTSRLKSPAANIRQSPLGRNISATFSFESVTDVLVTSVRFESFIDRNVDGSSYKDISLLCFGERTKPRENARVSHEASRRGRKTPRSRV